MLWRMQIDVPPGFEAVVNGRIEERRPLRVGRYDQMYYVNFAPFLATVSSEAPCKEGLMHTITVVVKLAFEKANVVPILQDAGYSTYRSVCSVSVPDHAARLNVLDAIKASLQTFTQDTEFFDLTKPEQVRQMLDQRVSRECEKARLAGEVVASQVVPVVPEPSLLAQLMAKAGIKETTQGDVRTRVYTDPNLGGIVEYFLETFRQSELIGAEIERARAEAERARVEAHKQMAITRAEVKLVELEQEERIAARQAAFQEEEVKRQQAAQMRNAAIKESGAAYEFAYHSKRLEEKMALAHKELEIAKVKDTEEAAIRERKRLDMQLEVERERELARIHAEKHGAIFTPLGGLVEKLAAVPTPDYTGVHTLINPAGLGGVDTREFATGLVLGLLSRVAHDEGIPAGAGKNG